MKHAVEELDLVLKVRVAYLDDPDFIEIELARTDLTFANLLRTCCDELGADLKRVRGSFSFLSWFLEVRREISRFNISCHCAAFLA